MLNKKGISGVIVTVIMIGLVVVTVSIVWTVINNLVSEKISNSQSCFGNFEKITIGKRYTCYDPDLEILRFSINLEDVEVDSVLVSASGAETKIVEIKKEYGEVSGLVYYPSGTPVKLPDKDGGKSYAWTWANTDPPVLIQIAPIIDGNQCEVSDSLSQIDDCSALA